MSATRATPLLQIITRRLSRTATQRAQASEVPSGHFKAMKENQKKFQIEDHQPIYIKGGFGDKALFGLTCILTAVGVAMTGEVLYKLSFPAK